MFIFNTGHGEAAKNDKRVARKHQVRFRHVLALGRRREKFYKMGVGNRGKYCRETDEEGRLTLAMIWGEQCTLVTAQEVPSQAPSGRHCSAGG